MKVHTQIDSTQDRATSRVSQAIVPHSSGSDNAGGVVINRVPSAVADAAHAAEAAAVAAQAVTDNALNAFRGIKRSREREHEMCDLAECYKHSNMYRPVRAPFMEPLPWLARKMVVETKRPSDEEWAAFCAKVE